MSTHHTHSPLGHYARLCDCPLIKKIWIRPYIPFPKKRFFGNLGVLESNILEENIFFSSVLLTSLFLLKSETI